MNSSQGLSQDVRWTALWRSRELVAYFALRDIRLRYRQAVLGIVWVLAQPVAGVAIFTLVFSRIAHVDSQGIPYPLFALVGMVTWTYFASAVMAGSATLVANASLVTKVYFPRVVAPAAALLPPAIDLAVSMVLVFAVAGYYRWFAGANLATLPLWMLFLAATAFGTTLWLSAMNVRYRDVQYAIAPVLQLWLFASPVVYPATLLSGWPQVLYSINPMAGVIALGRWCMLGAPWPGWSLLVSSASTLVLLASGHMYFHRAQRSFADVI